MSADNYYEIDYRPEFNRSAPWAVTMGSMSDDRKQFDPDDAVWFSTNKAAADYAWSQYSEYGVFLTNAANQQLVLDSRAKTDYDHTSGGNMVDIKATKYEVEAEDGTISVELDTDATRYYSGTDDKGPWVTLASAGSEITFDSAEFAIVLQLLTHANREWFDGGEV